ncbi:MAG: ABC transporter permease [Bdellovibrionales bacterium]
MEIKRNLRWVPFLFFLYRDVKRFLKIYLQTIFIPLMTQALYLIIFGVSLGKVVQISDQFSYLQFIIPGLISMTAINQAFQNGSSSIFVMKITGEIIDIKSTALSVPQIVLGVGLSGFLRGGIVSLLTLGIGEIFHYFYQGFFFPVAHIYWLLGFICLSSFSFAMIGLSIGVVSKTFDQVGAISGFVIIPLIYLGGVFFDLEKLSVFWQNVSVFNPLFYFVNGIRYSFLGVSDTPLMQSFVVSIASVGIAFLIACKSVSRGSFKRTS